MFRILIFNILGLICLLPAHAQRYTPGRNADSLSWELYQQARWDELLRTGRKMNRAGIDYFYLRMRMAVAALETGRYDAAATHLNKALHFNPYDRQAQRLLVLARTYSLMPAEAGAVFARLPVDQRDGLPLQPGFAPLSAHLDLGQNLTSLKLSRDFNTLTGNPGIYGSQSGLRESSLADAGLWMQLSPGWLLYGGIQRMTHIFEQNFAYLEPALKPDRVELNGNFKDFYYRLDQNPVVHDARNITLQNTIYFQLRHAPSHRLSLIASGSLTKLASEYSYAFTDTIEFSDTARLDLSSGLATLFSVAVPKAKIAQNIWQTTDWRITLGAQLQLGKTSLMSGIHLGKVNDTSLMQLHGGYLWRPSGNARTWQQTELMALRISGQWRTAIKINAGQWLGSKTSISATLLTGQLNGMADQWGYLMLNHRDKITLFGEASLTQQITRPLFLNMRYRYGKSVSFGEQIDDNGQLIISGKPLISQGIIGGLVWNF
ncbi:MAG: hypothetical protein IPM52_09805 [Bacteroidetes bacterium]|nr:hypothetical protein [Bacteroidota bacterium]